jgi:hypothetical protein
MSYIRLTPSREQQFTRQFKKWNFSKYQRRLGAEEWDFIGKRIYKRKERFGKDSEVYIDGTKYSAKRLKKEAYGKAFVRTYDKFESTNGKSHYTRSSRCVASTEANRFIVPSPQTPDGMLICTPASPSSSPVAAQGLFQPGMYVTWNESLPWLRFSKLLQQGEHQGMYPCIT